MNFDLKKTLKNFKLNEEKISMVLGALVILIVGIIVVNYFKDRSAGKITDTSSLTENSNTPGGEHVVVKGETLWSIAEDAFGSGYNWVDIKVANNLKSDKIIVGQKLTLPEVAAKKPTSTAKVANVDTNKISSDTYTVVKGDNLWKIAVRAYGDGYKWVEVAKVNNLSHPNLVHPGNVLTLPR